MRELQTTGTIKPEIIGVNSSYRGFVLERENTHQISLIEYRIFCVGTKRLVPSVIETFEQSDIRENFNDCSEFYSYLQKNWTRGKPVVIREDITFVSYDESDMYDKIITQI